MNAQPLPLTPAKADCLADILRPDRNSFGVIRLVLAVAVLVSHAYFFVSGDGATEPLVWLTGHSLGEHAVQAFFLLSGLLVTESLIRSGSIVSFACGRVLRVFPGLIVCVALVTFLLGPLVTHLSLAEYFADARWLAYVAKTVLLVTGAAELPGTFTTLPAAGLVDMSLWTLKYEMICYIGLGALGAAGLFTARYQRHAAAGLALLLCVIWLRPADPLHSNSLVEHVRYFALYFGVGTLAALLKSYIPMKRWLVLPLLALFAGAIGTPLQELTCALFLGYATLVAATFRFGPLRAWCNRHDISFGVYIYAAPIQQALLQANPGIHPLVLSLAALAIVTVVAGLSWALVEKPAMALRPMASASAGRVLARLVAVAGRLQPAILPAVLRSPRR